MDNKIIWECSWRRRDKGNIKCLNQADIVAARVKEHIMELTKDGKSYNLILSEVEDKK